MIRNIMLNIHALQASLFETGRVSMLRILHASYQRFCAPGIIKQLETEQEAAGGLGLNWKSRLFLPRDISSGSKIVVHGKLESHNGRGSRREYYQWLKKEAQESDIILLRYLAADPSQFVFVAQTNKPVFFVHHTIESAEILSAGTLKSCIKWLFERVIGPACLSRAAGIIAVTGEIGAYELGRIRGVWPALIYPNGIAMSADLVRLTEVPQTEPIKMAFVASSFVSWHGLDRLIEAARLSTDEFTIHVIGKVPQKEQADAEGDERFVFHGVLTADKISELLSTCGLALSSFALDRKRMTEACTLKVRQYLASGMPVYSGHRDVFPDDFPFYRSGPCDMQAILRMAREASSWGREEIRSAATPYIDKTILVSRLYTGLSDLHGA